MWFKSTADRSSFISINFIVRVAFGTCNPEVHNDKTSSDLCSVV